MGAEFAASKNFAREPDDVLMNGPYGTFGGYVKFAEQKFGLVNYHAVRENLEGFIFVNADRNDPNKGVVTATDPEGSELDTSGQEDKIWCMESE
ncbi:MAG: hypothetical protein MMC33_003228 [Icmadophila ericetorum]|nr:hypothetical protein [Icmadophila ericetorum]